MTNYKFSKSSFLKGLQCEKQLYLYKHHYDWQDPVSESQQAIFDRGTNVGLLARDLFPGGVDVSPPTHRDYDIATQNTLQEIDNGAEILYEPSFIYNDVLVALDILIKDKDKWKAYEVKSSTSIKNVNILDASVQYYVIKNSGIDLNDISIVYLNNQYIKQGDLELDQLFNKDSVLDKVLEQQNFIEKKIERFKNLIKEKDIPDIDIGPHCDDPYTCSFYGHCWEHIPEYSIFNISRLRADQKFDLYNQGIVNLEDVPKDYNLSDSQRMQVDSHNRNERIIDKPAIRDFLSSLSYPLYFMDFETFMPAVPLYDDSRPYQQIPFQYSLHYQEDHHSELEHFEFLGEPHNDPRILFIENLLRDTEGEGVLLVYNQAFEATRLKEIARDFPQYANDIEERLTRIKDLMMPFQKKYYYVPEMKGSYSIKNILPALVPEMSYRGMDISEGGEAMIAFESLLNENDPKAREKIRKNLLEYCKMDTMVMVKILTVLLENE